MERQTSASCHSGSSRKQSTWQNPSTRTLHLYTDNLRRQPIYFTNHSAFWATISNFNCQSVHLHRFVVQPLGSSYNASAIQSLAYQKREILTRKLLGRVRNVKRVARISGHNRVRQTTVSSDIMIYSLQHILFSSRAALVFSYCLFIILSRFFASFAATSYRHAHTHK